MAELFHLVLTTSLYAGVAGVVIILLKALLKNKINAFWHYFIWVVLILKLLVPFGPESAYSLFNRVPVQVVQSKAAVVAPHDAAEYAGIDLPALPAADTLPSTPAQVQRKDAAPDVLLPYVWAAGAVLLLLCLLISNYSLHRKLRKNMPAPDERLKNIFVRCQKKIGVQKNIEIVLQDVVGAPSLFGLIWPKILLTPAVSGLSDRELEYVLLHELAHYQRKDVLVNYLLLLLQIVHWFNPVIWYCFKRLRQDMEAATDEKVLGILEKDEHKEYGRALLAVLDGYNQTRMAPRLLGMVDDRKNIEERIRMIKMAGFFQRNKRVVMVMGFVSVLLLGGVLLTNGKSAGINGRDYVLPAGYSAGVLYRYKSPYIGDSSNISNLLNALPLAEYKSKIYLDTEKEPYGLTVLYEYNQKLAEDLRSAGIDLESAVLLPDSMILFSLIDNLDNITYNIRMGGTSHNYTYTRGALQIYFERDMREYSRDKSDFEEFISYFHTNEWKTSALLNYLAGAGVNLNNVKEIRIESFEEGGLVRAQTDDLELIKKLVGDMNNSGLVPLLLPQSEKGAISSLSNGVYIVFNTGGRDNYFYIDYTSGGIAKYAPYMSSWPVCKYRFKNVEELKAAIDLFLAAGVQSIGGSVRDEKK